jgi:rhomboid protease GluP
LEFSPRLRWKIERFWKQLSGQFGGEENQPRPKLCPSCGTLVGAGATRCHQCGASMTFSVAAASRSISQVLPTTSPATYGIPTLSCVLYGFSLLWTARTSGFQSLGGGLNSLFNIGGIDGSILLRLGMSLPPSFPFHNNLSEPWRLVMAIFLHGSLLHLGFNMWVLMDVGPQIEELYGSARYFFIYVLTGIVGYIVSSVIGGHPSVGGSGALLGLIGVLLAFTMGRQAIGMKMLRGQLIRWLVYLLVWGLIFPGIDNYAHVGGLAAGFILGKIMMDHAPSSPEERKSANLLGWATALAVTASLVLMVMGNLRAG